jgi:hypothetical protein
MTVYIFAGWPVGMKENEEPARFLHDSSVQVCAVESTKTAGESLPDCRERLMIAAEATALGITVDSFSPDHDFGNGVTCGVISLIPDSPPIQLSWIVTPRVAGSLSAGKYSELKGLMVKKRT